MDRFLSSATALGPIPLLGLLFLAYAGGSLTWSSGGLYAGAYLVSLVIAFAIGLKARGDLWPFWYIFVWGVSVNVVIAILGWYFPIEGFLLSYGLFGGSNYLGAACALAISAAIAYQFWFFLPALAYGLWHCQSRAAFFATGVAIFFGLLPRFRFLALCGLILGVLFVVAASGERSFTLLARLGIWQDTIDHIKPFGSGWGSFAEAYAAFPVKRNMTGMLASHAYNDFLELVFELGIGTIPLWLMIILAFEGTDAKARLICLTFLALSLTFFPLHTLVVGQAFAVALGQLARSRVPQRGGFSALAHGELK